MSTDSGGEFRGVDSIMKDRGGVHRLKVGRNDIAVVDRALQTLKAKLANAGANHGGSWDKNLGKVIKSYNDNPRNGVHGPPATAGNLNSVQGFVNLQDQGNNFGHNYKTWDTREEDLYAAGALRPAIEDGSRGHKPRYGKVAQLDRVLPGGLYAQDTEGNKHLIKTSLITNQESAEPKAVFGTQEKRPKRPTFEEVRARLRKFRAMHGPIPAAASRVYEPSAPSGIAHQPAASLLNPQPVPSRFEALRSVFGDRPPRSPEEEAAAQAKHQERKANAAAKRAEEERKRQEKKAAREAKEQAIEDEKARKRAAREAAKAAKGGKK